MTYNPASKLVLKAEIEINGTWIEITSRTQGGREAGGVRIQPGRSPGAVQAEPARMECVIGNDDGYLTEGSPFSPWYPYIRRGCPIRLSIVGVLGSDAQRFAGKIDTIRLEFPAPDVCKARIVAFGTLGDVLQSDDPAHSPIYRTMIGVSPDDYQPDYYWPGEDGSDATAMSAAISGTSDAAVSGTVTFGGDSTLTGSDPLPTFAVGATVNAYAPTSHGSWVVSWWAKIDSEPSATVTLLQMRTTGGSYPLIEVTLVPGSPSALHVIARNAAGTALIDETMSMNSGNRTEANFYGKWLLYTVRHFPETAPGVSMSVRTIEYPFSDSAPVSTNSLFASASNGVLGTTFGELVSIQQPGHVAQSFGHLTVYDTDAFVLDDGDTNNVLAMLGYDGEEAHTRFARLCRESGITSTVTATSSAEMGPQPTGTLPDLLQECEDADQGIQHDGATDGALAYVALNQLYNQTPALTISTDMLARGLEPIWDNQQVVNDVTSSRPTGSSARYADEVHVAATKVRRRGAKTVNVSTDGRLRHDAAFRVARGTAEGPRFNKVTINLRNTRAALLADAILGLSIGERISIGDGALPDQMPPNGLDLIVLGWTELLDAYQWEMDLLAVPANPYTVAAYGSDADQRRYDSRYSTLSTGYSKTATSLVVNIASGPLWITTATHPSRFPFNITIAGLVYSCTGISGTSSPQTFTIVRLAQDKTLASGEPVHVYQPARYAL